MLQSRLSSLIEAGINAAIGIVISMCLTSVVFPAFGARISFIDNVLITAIYTATSIARGYAVRRWFNARIHRAAERLSGQEQNGMVTTTKRRSETHQRMGESTRRAANHACFWIRRNR